MLKLRASLDARFEAMSSLDKSSFVLGNELREEHFESLLALVKAYIIDIWEERKSKLYGDVECAQQPRPYSPTGDLGEIAGVNGQNSEGMCQGGKPGTGKLYTDVCLCCSAHTSGCVVDGYGSILSIIIIVARIRISQNQEMVSVYTPRIRPLAFGKYNRSRIIPRVSGDIGQKPFF